MEVIMSGVITAILPVQQGVSQKSGNAWASQEYVLCHEQGQYPRYVCFRVFGQDKIQQMNIQMGEQLTIHLNIDAKQSNSKPGQFFNSIDCWRVDRMGQMQQQPMMQVPMQQQPLMQQQQVQQPAPFPPAGQQQAAAPFPPAGQQQVQQPTQAPLPFPPAGQQQ